MTTFENIPIGTLISNRHGDVFIVISEVYNYNNRYRKLFTVKNKSLRNPNPFFYRLYEESFNKDDIISLPQQQQQQKDN